MLATQMPDMPAEAKDVKQIKEKLAQSLKALQKRYVTSDAVVTSEDADANLLCSALEAIFIHGIKSKFVRSEAAGRSRKALPQPFFWSLLKTVTHRDVITELEKVSFVGTEVGRCRSWLRLALNHGLLECYLASLFREDSKLRSHYQPSALLLDTEEREVLLSYLQGLSSLTFSLSYKSAVLNQWTATPLALAGLCPASQADVVGLNGCSLPSSKPPTKELWDSASQSSGSSDTLDKSCPASLQKECTVSQGSRTALHSSNLSLDTSGSSQLSSSLSSDSLLQGQDTRCSTAEQWSSSDLETNTCSKTTQKNSLSDFRESGQCSQDSMREDSYISSPGPDQLSETGLFSSSDSEIPNSPPAPPPPPPPPPLPLPAIDSAYLPTNGVPPDSRPPPAALTENLDQQLSDSPEPSADGDLTHSASELVEETLEETRDVQEDVESDPENPERIESERSRRSTSILSNKQSSDSLTHSRSWISEDDIYKPHLDELLDSEEAPPPPPDAAPAADSKVSQSPPSVVHRRQIGLSNPFRGLLKLGHLERRSAMGMWRDYYCELSPFEFRLYLNAEERTCCDNCSLLRCDDVRIASPDGRFELAFPGKRLYLRAANRDEAEDWVDRIVEAVNKCRPASCVDEWEVLLPACENGVDERTLCPPPSSPELRPSSSDVTAAQEALPPSEELDWTRAAQLETDAIKESVLYFSTDCDARTWTPLVFSLSLETLKGFKIQDGRKLPRLSHAVEEIRDVVPDVSQGSPAFFKLLTVRETLRLRAESAEEARSWRSLIRRALDSYLEMGEDGAVEGEGLNSGQSGNLRRLVQHRLKEDGALLMHLCSVPSEKGLDAQSFKCAGCPQPIGPSRGRAKICEFSGLYYCESCHAGETSIIPSRMLHNWDLTPREVSKKAVQLLAQVEHEPLLSVEQLNPELVVHAELMAQAHLLRQKLRLLGDYLLTCRRGACKKLQARMGQRTYLLESEHLYSVTDLRQIAERQYADFLLTLLHLASNHVFQCDLCTQRGFICQICHSDDIIFPFQLDSTTRCKECKAVFHLDCKPSGRSCPRCERMKKYLERDLQD